MIQITTLCLVISSLIFTVEVSSENIGYNADGKEKPIGVNLDRKIRSVSQHFGDYEDFAPVKNRGKLFYVQRKGSIAEFIPRLGKRMFNAIPDPSNVNNWFEEPEDMKQYIPIYMVPY